MHPSEGCTFSCGKPNQFMCYLDGRTSLDNRGSQEDEGCPLSNDVIAGRVAVMSCDILNQIV